MTNRPARASRPLFPAVPTDGEPTATASTASGSGSGSGSGKLIYVVTRENVDEIPPLGVP
ncbi:hypothetical protein [Streptomyces sp. HF10]|uniref:hypothetical protein n=1 Tax=Streptomyces sp. HF10 TaxID=2692233 RepID=UPI0013163A2F|nr:hypothetical protein [Streptomyces sp. HF10]QHC28073.1 hypothetical protein GR129_03760 [Streptomyces sp. HF10]